MISQTFILPISLAHSTLNKARPEGAPPRHKTEAQTAEARTERRRRRGKRNSGTPPRHGVDAHAAEASEIVAHRRGTEPRHKPWHRTEPRCRGTEPRALEWVIYTKLYGVALLLEPVSGAEPAAKLGAKGLKAHIQPYEGKTKINSDASAPVNRNLVQQLI